MANTTRFTVRQIKESRSRIRILELIMEGYKSKVNSEFEHPISSLILNILHVDYKLIHGDAVKERKVYQKRK